MTTSPIVVTGMHRSGTSMVAALLEGCGVHLGEPNELIPAAADNPTGFWEHERITSLNDRLLAELGGAWDAPPSRPAGWHRADRFGGLRAEAADIVEQLQDRGTWGFKDPRVMLLADFWADVCGPLRLVVCVRNPLEVARSLHARNGHSAPLALRLWWSYDRSLQDTIDASPDCFSDPIVTHYRAVLEAPDTELGRLCAALGLDTDRIDALAEERIDRGLRHHRLGGQELADVGASMQLQRRYRELCERAGFADGSPALRATASSDTAPASENTSPRSQNDDRDDDTSEADRIGRVDLARLDHAELLSRYHVRGGHIAILERRLAEAAARIVHLEGLALDAERQRAAAPTALPTSPIGVHPDAALADRLDDLALRLEAASGDPIAGHAFAHRRMRRLLETTEPHTRIGVVGGCDDAPPGRHINEIAPTSGAETLDLLGAEGIDVFAVPHSVEEADESIAQRLTSLGWARHSHTPGVGTLWHLVPRPTSTTDQLDALCDEVELRSGRPATVLDLTAGRAADALPARIVFRSDAGDPTRLLPASVDIVLRDRGDAGAGSADLGHPAAAMATAVLERDDVTIIDHGAPGRVPTVSLVLAGMHPRFARALLRNRPRWWNGEVVTDLGPEAIGPAVEGLSLIAGDGSATPLGELVDAAGGEVIVCVSGMWLPTSGSLAALVDALSHPSVGHAPAGLAVARTARPDHGEPDPVVHGEHQVAPIGPDWEVRRNDGPFGGTVVAVGRAAWAEAGGFSAAASGVHGSTNPSDVAAGWADLGVRIRDDWESVWVPESRWIGLSRGTDGAS